MTDNQKESASSKNASSSSELPSSFGKLHLQAPVIYRSSSSNQTRRNNKNYPKKNQSYKNPKHSDSSSYPNETSLFDKTAYHHSNNYDNSSTNNSEKRPTKVPFKKSNKKNQNDRISHDQPKDIQVGNNDSQGSNNNRSNIKYRKRNDYGHRDDYNIEYNGNNGRGRGRGQDRSRGRGRGRGGHRGRNRNDNQNENHFKKDKKEEKAYGDIIKNNINMEEGEDEEMEFFWAQDEKDLKKDNKYKTGRKNRNRKNEYNSNEDKPSYAGAFTSKRKKLSADEIKREIEEQKRLEAQYSSTFRPKTVVASSDKLINPELSTSSSVIQAGKKKKNTLTEEDILNQRIEERNKRMANALQIDYRSHEMPAYTEELTEFGRSNLKFVFEVESVFEVVLRSNVRNNYHMFKPMAKVKRGFIHDLAEFYKIDTESIDPEPYRTVIARKTLASKLPMYLLSDVIQDENKAKILEQKLKEKEEYEIYKQMKEEEEMLSSLRTPQEKMERELKKLNSSGNSRWGFSKNQFNTKGSKDLYKDSSVNNSWESSTHDNEESIDEFEKEVNEKNETILEVKIKEENKFPYKKKKVREGVDNPFLLLK